LNRKINSFLRVLGFLAVLCVVTVGLFYKLTYEPKAEDAYRSAIKYSARKFCNNFTKADSFEESKVIKINSNEYKVESKVYDEVSKSSIRAFPLTIREYTEFAAIMRYEGRLFGNWKVVEFTDLTEQKPEIFECIDKRDKERLIELLDSGLDVNKVYDKKKTALIRAVERRNTELVRLLVEDYGADVNIQPSKRPWIALHVAVENGNEEIVKILLDHGADLEIKDNWHMTPIFMANDSLDTVLQLVSAGADLNTVERFGGDTPLAKFVGRGCCDIEVLRALAKKTIDLETPLLIAVKDNNKAVIKMLLEEGANKNIRDAKGNQIIIK